MRLRVAKKLLCYLLIAAALLLTVAVFRMSVNLQPTSAPIPTTTIPSLEDIAQARKAPWNKPRHPKEDSPDLPAPSPGKTPPHPLPDGLLGEGFEPGLPGQAEKDGDSGPTGFKNAGPSAKSSIEEADALWDLVQTHTAPHVHEDNKPLGQTCVPKHHVFFGKVHKTGSSTIANILQRYGFTRKLNFVLPRKTIHSRSYNYISTPGQKATRDKLIPPPVGEHYDILWSHAIYDSEFYHQLMPKDTVYVSILRQPLQQFQSAFEYYGHIPGSFLYTILQTNVSNPLTMYLHNHTKYEAAGVYTSYVRNKQAQDLGMRNFLVPDAERRHEYIQQLDQDFDLVMVTEFFDESLVLLRRLLCWTVKDILYIPKNKNNFKKQRDFTAKDIAAHKKLNVADYELYDIFLARFNHSVAKQGPDFKREVQYFKAVLKKVQYFCLVVGQMGGGGSGGPQGFAPLSVSKSEWSDAFHVTPDDCRMMQKHELIFLDDLMVDAIRRYQKSVSQQALGQS